MICGINRCEKSPVAKSMCMRHYARAKSRAGEGYKQLGREQLRELAAAVKRRKTPQKCVVCGEEGTIARGMCWADYQWARREGFKVTLKEIRKRSRNK